MSRLAFLRGREPAVFHVRMGGCGGCCEVVDSVLRDGRGARGRECSSPRHAEVVIVSGCWTEDLSDAAARVISQAPVTRKLVVVGDCALGLGFVAQRIRHGQTVSSRFEPDLEIAGCPADAATVLEGVRRVTG